MSIAAGNSGPKQYTVGAPGNARHVLTVTGTDKKKEIPWEEYEEGFRLMTTRPKCCGKVVLFVSEDD